MAFRATVQPEGTAPDISQRVQFIPSPDLPAPSQVLVPSSGTILCGWPVVPSSSFDPPLEGSVLLGYLRVTLPYQAMPGQVYTVRFANTDGSPDLQTQYDFETKPGSLWVLGPRLRPDQVSSDEWRVFFFGSITAPVRRGRRGPGPRRRPELSGVPDRHESD